MSKTASTQFRPPTFLDPALPAAIQAPSVKSHFQVDSHAGAATTSLRFYVALLAASSAALLGGCDSFRGAQQPLDSATSQVALAQKYSPQVVLASAYAQSDTARDGLSKRDYRDMVIGIRRIAIEARYQAFVGELREARVGVGFGGDLIVLTLGAVGTVVGGAATKSVLAAATAGVAGASASFSKNLFYDQTLPAIIAQMDAQRDMIKLDIAKKLTKDVADYSMGDALLDLQELERVGSIETAIKAITDAATNEAKKAATDLQTFQISRSVGDQTFIASKDGNARLKALLAAVSTLPDATAVALAQKPPVADPALDKVIAAMVGQVGTLTASQARDVLKRRIALVSGQADIQKWETALKP